MNSPSRLSRRRLLQVTSAGLAVSIAGCSGDSNDNGNGNNDGNEDGENDENGDEPEVVEYDSPGEMSLAGDVASEFRGWLLPGFTEESEGVEVLCQFDNFRALSGGQNPVSAQRETMAGILGVDPGSMSWALGVGSEPSGRLGWIYSGDFDQEAVANHLTESQELYYVGPLEGYEVLGTDGGQAVAVGSETIIEHPRYDAFIEAEQGEREGLDEADEDVSLALDVLPSGLRIPVTRRPEQPTLEVSATSYQVYEEGSPTGRVRTFVFDEAANATLENAREIISADGLESDNIRSAEVSGRVFMLHYRG